MSKNEKSFWSIAILIVSSIVTLRDVVADTSTNTYPCGRPKEVANYNILKNPVSLEKSAASFKECINKMIIKENKQIDIHTANLNQLINDWNDFVNIYNKIDIPLWERKAKGVYDLNRAGE